MTLDQINESANNATFRLRIKIAMYKAAVAIVGEDTSGMSEGKASKRHQLGVQVLSGNGSSLLNSFVLAVSTQEGEVADPTAIADVDIESAVSAVWDDIAGVTYTEATP